MLRKLEKGEFEQYVDFAYQLAMDLTKSSFPVYTDGVKTKEFFVCRSQKGLEREDEEILLFEQNGEVEGWIHYHHIDEDNYIGINSILIRTRYATALAELFKYWRGKFSGYTWCMYFPEENEEARSFMKEQGYQDESQEIVDVLLFENYLVKEEREGVIAIGQENYDIFREIHRLFEEEMYWTSDRIAASLEDWEIFAYMENGKCQGALYHNGKGEADLEIFGIDGPGGAACDARVTEKLLICCLNKAKARHAKSMYFFNDKSTHEIAHKLGFTYITTAYYFEGKVM